MQKEVGYLSQKHIFEFSGTPGILNYEAATKEKDVSEANAGSWDSGHPSIVNNSSQRNFLTRRAKKNFKLKRLNKRFNQGN